MFQEKINYFIEAFEKEQTYLLEKRDCLVKVGNVVAQFQQLDDVTKDKLASYVESVLIYYAESRFSETLKCVEDFDEALERITNEAFMSVNQEVAEDLVE